MRDGGKELKRVGACNRESMLKVRTKQTIDEVLTKRTAVYIHVLQLSSFGGSIGLANDTDHLKKRE